MKVHFNYSLILAGHVGSSSWREVAPPRESQQQLQALSLHIQLYVSSSCSQTLATHSLNFHPQKLVIPPAHAVALCMSCLLAQGSADSATALRAGPCPGLRSATSLPAQSVVLASVHAWSVPALLGFEGCIVVVIPGQWMVQRVSNWVQSQLSVGNPGRHPLRLHHALQVTQEGLRWHQQHHQDKRCSQR